MRESVFESPLVPVPGRIIGKLVGSGDSEQLAAEARRWKRSRRKVRGWAAAAVRRVNDVDVGGARERGEGEARERAREAKDSGSHTQCKVSLFYIDCL